MRSAACSLALAMLFALPPPASAADARTLLTDGTHASAHTSYVGEIENIRFGAHGTRAIVLRVEHLAPDLTRRAYLAPESLYGNSIVIDAQHVYEFDVHHRRVITSVQHDPNDFSTMQSLGLVMRNYRAVLGAVNTIAGVRAQSVTLLNRYTGEKSMTLWIAENTHLIVGKEAYHKDGSLAYQMRFETLRYTADIPRNIFSVATPAGFTVTDREPPAASPAVVRSDNAERFTPHEPRFLPEGFHLVATTEPRIHGVSMVHILYSDGVRSFSIFENDRNAVASLSGFTPAVVRIGDHEGRLIASGSNSLLTWRDEKHITFTLVGDLSDQELTRIAQTLR